ncbi:Putative inner membrane protein YqgA [Salmonella enterica subsp. enterica]|nr:Putative inner membrane protein YqgA [Salmonella enterica subsp. enterica]
MVIGPFINAGAILFGGVIGALLSQRLPERIRVSMTSIFGLCSLGIGILLVMKCANLPVMVLATLVGALSASFVCWKKALMAQSRKSNNYLWHRVRSRHTTHLFKVTSLSLYFFAPAAPVFSARCMKG